MLNIIRLVINQLKIRRAKNQFYNFATIGKNFVCRENSLCANESKNPSNIIIGDNVSILGQILAEHVGTIMIGDYTTIRGNTRIVATDKIVIGKYVIISNNVIIMDNNSHPTDIAKRREMSLNKPGTELWRSKYADHKPITIEDSVWIGERAVILKGVKIGYGSIIASDSVVTHDVPSYCIVAGNPARVVKQLEYLGDKHTDERYCENY